MQFKPFKRPTFVSGPPAHTQQDDRVPASPPAKKRRISDDKEFRKPVKIEETPSLSQPIVAFRRPLVTVQHSSSQDALRNENGDRTRRVYSALWRKKTAKMHKTWDGDGTLIVTDGYATLKNDRGKSIGRTACKTQLEPGSTLSISGMDVEVEEELSAESGNEVQAGDRSAAPPLPVSKPSFKAQPTLSVLPGKLPAELLDRTSSKNRTMTQSSAGGTSHVTAAMPAARNNFLQSTTTGAGTTVPISKHDPHAENALVMQRPKSVPADKQIVDVVVDPFLCKHLREHQRVGVSFMYECVMGMRCKEGAGAILADEMGLGKSLQTIALLWTLLKQSPIYRDPPIVRKAIILCPASVTKNWRKEFRKWLGPERIGVLLLDDQKKIRSFIRGRSYQVLVVGYEMFNLVQKDLQKCKEIDIIIADEGHRLKTAKNKTTTAITELDIEKRIVLTGTLLQNDYSEWYSVVDFVNPGFLGKYASFKKQYQMPILRSRQQGASPEDIEKGEEADEELKQQTGSFILRRTVDILAQYLPAKTEYVVLCRPTKFQTDVYEAILATNTLTAALRNSELQFGLMTILKKACNSTSLLAATAQGNPKTAGEDESLNPGILSDLHTRIPARQLRTANSGKLRVLDSILHRIAGTTTEKVVIMSNYTSTLDVIGNLLDAMAYTYTRLDGSTPSSKRQDLVDSFNAAPQKKQFIFLLSTKAGGVGLNLIGASRLVLYDVDWNPALDLQAMGRVCRDGQKRACFIYRLVTAGAIEERIFQRQVVKMGLADSVVDNRKGESSFSQEELRDLFTIDKGEGCRTHELLGCGCGLDGKPLVVVDEVVVPEPESELEGPVDIGRRGFVSASRVDRVDPEGRSRETSPVKKTRRTMMGLMQYGHVDARKMRLESKAEAVEGSKAAVSSEGEGSEEEREDCEVDDKDWPVKDVILRDVILENESSVDFVFAKTSENNTAMAVEV